MSSEFANKHFRDNIVCTCNMIEQASHFNKVPDDIMNMLNYKLLKRCKFIFRTYLLKMCIPADTRSPIPVIPVHSVGNLQYMWQS